MNDGSPASEAWDERHFFKGCSDRIRQKGMKELRGAHSPACVLTPAQHGGQVIEASPALFRAAEAAVQVSPKPPIPGI